MKRLFAVVACLGMIACGGGDAPAPTQQAQQQPEKPPAQAPEPQQRQAMQAQPPGAQKGKQPPASYFELEPGSVVASIGDTEITLADVDAFMAGTLKALERKYNEAIPDDVLYERRLASLDRMVTEELLLQQAEERGVAADPAAVDAQIERAQGKADSRRMFEENLARQGMSLEQYRERILRQMTIRELTREVRDSSVGETDAAVQEYYEANKERFRQPEMVRVSQIYFRVAPNATEEDKAAVDAKVEEVIRKLDGGADFNEVASEYSDDPSARRGGRSSWIRRGQVPEEFEKVAFDLEAGTVSEPFTTSMGKHIVRVDEKRDAGVRPLDEVKPGILRHLRNEFYHDWQSKLREQSNVTVNM